MIDFPELVERELRAEHDSDSHREPDTETFHPSQLSQCARQCCISKFGLEEHTVNTLWNFKIGTERHEWLEQTFEPRLTCVEFEVRVEQTFDPGIRIVGRTDVYDAFENAIYDFKTRSNWYRYDGPKDYHIDQLHCYMACLDVSEAYLVYILKTGPNDDSKPIIRQEGPIAYEPERFERILDKAATIRERVTAEGIPETVEQVPFDPCGCWLCDKEAEA